MEIWKKMWVGVFIWTQCILNWNWTESIDCLRSFVSTVAQTVGPSILGKYEDISYVDTFCHSPTTGYVTLKQQASRVLSAVAEPIVYACR